MTDTETTGGVCATIEEESEPKTSDAKSETPAKESSSSENDSSVFKKIETDSIAPIAQSTPKSPLFMDDVLGGLSKVEREVMPTPREEKSPVESESNGTDTTSVATTVLPVEEPMVSVDVESEPEQDSISEQNSKNETTIDKLDSQEGELAAEQNENEIKENESTEPDVDEQSPKEDQSEVVAIQDDDDEQKVTEEVTAETKPVLDEVNNSLDEQAVDVVDDDVKSSQSTVDNEEIKSDSPVPQEKKEADQVSTVDVVSGLSEETKIDDTQNENPAISTETNEQSEQNEGLDEVLRPETEAEMSNAVDSPEDANDADAPEILEVVTEGNNDVSEGPTDTPVAENIENPVDEKSTNRTEVQLEEEQEEDISVRTQSTDDVQFSSTLDQKLDDASESKESEYVEAREEIDDQSPIQLVADVILNADPVAIADAVTDSVIEEIVDMKLEVESSLVVESSVEVKIEEKPVETLVDTSTDDLVEHSREINDVITGLFKKFDHLIPAYL